MFDAIRCWIFRKRIEAFMAKQEKLYREMVEEHADS
jgi:hypothetical protein